MISFPRTLLVAFSLQGIAVAYQQQPAAPNSRRAFVEKAVFGAAFLSSPLPAAAAVDACPKGSSNCIRTTWTAPSGTSASDMAKTIAEVLNSYPQEGQQDADKGGYTIVSDDLAGSSGKAVVEYKSGIGNFAKFLNGGKPFVDDLVVEIDHGKAEIRSASRVGESDFKVNQKRLQYLAKAIRSKGWEAPEPTY